MVILGFTLLAAVLAGSMPLELTIGAVFAFAGLHNWIELRYFLSKLPSQFGPLRGYFILAVVGVVLLSIAHIMGSLPLLPWWNTVFLTWLGTLMLMRSQQNPRRNVRFIIPLITAAIAASWLGPVWLSLFLVYLHPIIGIWILDLELRRKPHWRKWYRMVLLTVPLLLVAIFVRTANMPPTIQDESLLWELVMQVGGTVITAASPGPLIACHAFLELLHYGVWILAIPMVTMLTPAGALRAVPITRLSPQNRTAVIALSAIGGIAVLALWAGFSVDYVSTRHFYLTIAVVHMLAEIPFLIRLF